MVYMDDLIIAKLSRLFREKGWMIGKKFKYQDDLVRVCYFRLNDSGDIDKVTALSRYLKQNGFPNKMEFVDSLFFGPRMEIWISVSLFDEPKLESK